MQFRKLFQPAKIGKMEVRNRIIMAPMGTRFATHDGFINGRITDYYVERVRGGVGLVIVEALYIHPYPGRMLISDDRFIPGLKRLTGAIHDAGGRVAAQIQTLRGRNDLNDPVSPSPIPHPRTGVMPREISLDEIEKILEAFSKAAERVKKAGFDAIEIHGANGYLLSEFLSPLANKRADRYGGSLENRARFPKESIEYVRERVGPNFPIIYRLCADEHVEGGFSLQEAVPVSQILEQAGVDAIDVTSGSTVHTWEWIILPMGFPEGANVSLAEGIKKAVHIPIIVAGRLKDPYLAERVLQQGKADLISLGRALLADPEWPNKVRKERLEDICPCISCLRCQDKRLRDKVGVKCSVNPALGREESFRVRSIEKAKRVTVVGGGPAGMEVALIAAQKGHKVTLFEKQDRLGGNLLPASMPDFKGDFRSLINFFSTQIQKNGVEIQLGIEATPEIIRETKPEVLFIATGSTPIIPQIPGAEKGKVVTAADVLLGKKDVSESVIVIGGGLVGCETALYLAQNGKRVAIIEVLDSVVPDLDPVIRRHLLKLLDGANVQILTATTVTKITEEGVVLVDRDGKKTTLEGKSVLIAAGFKSNTKLLESLKERMSEVYAIGDCVRPGMLAKALDMGFQEALEIL